MRLCVRMIDELSRGLGYRITYLVISHCSVFRPFFHIDLNEKQTDKFETKKLALYQSHPRRVSRPGQFSISHMRSYEFGKFGSYLVRKIKFVKLVHRGLLILTAS